MTGTGAPSISLTMVRVEVEQPAGSVELNDQRPRAILLCPRDAFTNKIVHRRIDAAVDGDQIDMGPGPFLGLRPHATAPSTIRQEENSLSVFTAQLFNDFFDIFPDQLFVRRIAQQISRMERRHEFDPVIAGPSAAHFADRHLALSSVCTANLPRPTMISGRIDIDLFF